MLRLFTDQQRAVLYKGRYGDDGVFHMRQYTGAALKSCGSPVVLLFLQ
jgi:hypothetical protein